MMRELTAMEIGQIDGGDLGAAEGSVALVGIALGAAAVGMTVAAPVAAVAAVIAGGIAVYEAVSK